MILPTVSLHNVFFLEYANATCSFEEPCQWRIYSNGIWRWTIRSGSTGTRDTGPTGDHTTGTGIYVFSLISVFVLGPCTFICLLHSTQCVPYLSI